MFWFKKKFLFTHLLTAHSKKQMASLYPLFTYNPDGTTFVRKTISPANATSSTGVAEKGYFVPANVWSVTGADLQNALVINTQVSFAAINERKQLHNAKIALLYNTAWLRTQQGLWRYTEGAMKAGFDVSLTSSTKWVGHVFRPNYNSVKEGPTTSDLTDGMGIWNNQPPSPSKNHYMFRLTYLVNAQAAPTNSSFSSLGNVQGGGDVFWWYFAANSSPIQQVDFGDDNGYGDVLTYQFTNGSVTSMFTTRCDTDNGTWTRRSNMQNDAENWTITSQDAPTPVDGGWWHGIVSRDTRPDIAQCVGYPNFTRRNVQLTPVILEPSPYMQVYFCLLQSNNTEAKMSALLQQFSEALTIIFGETLPEITPTEVAEICVILGWYNDINQLVITNAANLLVGSFIANDTDPRAYASLTSSLRYKIQLFAQSCVIQPNVNLDAPFIRFAAAQFASAPANLLQLFPECGCYMPSVYMDAYWSSLRTQLLIPVGLQRPECFFAPCTSNSNPVKTTALLRTPGQVVSCGPLVSCVNYQTTTITNSGEIAGNVNIDSSSVCQAAFNEVKPDGSGTSDGGSGGSGGSGTTGDSSDLSAGAISGIVIGSVVFVLALGLGLVLGLKAQAAAAAAKAGK